MSRREDSAPVLMSPTRYMRSGNGTLGREPPCRAASRVDMRFRSVFPIALTVLLAVGVAASIFETGHLRDDRDGSRSELAAARQSLLITRERLDVTIELKDAYRRSSAHLAPDPSCDAVSGELR